MEWRREWSLTKDRRQHEPNILANGEKGPVEGDHAGPVEELEARKVQAQGFDNRVQVEMSCIEQHARPKSPTPVQLWGPYSDANFAPTDDLSMQPQEFSTVRATPSIQPLPHPSPSPKPHLSSPGRSVFKGCILNSAPYL